MKWIRSYLRMKYTPAMPCRPGFDEPGNQVGFLMHGQDFSGEGARPSHTDIGIPFCN